MHFLFSSIRQQQTIKSKFRETGDEDSEINIEFVEDETCEFYGYEKIEDVMFCRIAADLLEGQYGIKSDYKFMIKEDGSSDDRPQGCTYHPFGNVELWPNQDTGKCNTNGWAGCFCLDVVESYVTYFFSCFSEYTTTSNLLKIEIQMLRQLLRVKIRAIGLKATKILMEK